MVRLKSYVCYKCKRGYHDFQNERDKAEFGYICTKSGLIACLECRGSDGDLFRNPVDYHFLNLIAKAPEEELIKLEFCKWSPFRCENCTIPIVNKSQLVVYQGEIFCHDCILPGNFSHSSRNTILEKLYADLLLELKPFYRNTISKPIKPRPLAIFDCSRCKKSVNRISLSPFGKYKSGAHIFTNGELICHKCICRDGVSSIIIRSMLVMNVVSPLYLQFFDYVADPADLKLLTYSNWVGLRCSLCSVHFSCEIDQLPMFQRCCKEMMCKKCSDRHEPSLRCCSILGVYNSYVRRLVGSMLDVTPHVVMVDCLVDALSKLPEYFKKEEISTPPTRPKEINVELAARRHVSSVPLTPEIELGRGGQGCVRKEVITVAVKKCHCGADANKRKMANREANVLQNLRHPNIVKYYDSDWDENHKMMIVKMELCGENLRHFIGLPVSHQIQVAWCHDIFNALHYLKTQRVFHRDIKPENILTVQTEPQRGALKLCDFGLSKVWSTGTHTQNQWHTPGYLDPEAQLDPNNFCFESDLYSAGVTLWEVVNQRHVSYFVHNASTNDAPLLQLIFKCTVPLLSERISVEEAYTEIDTIKGRVIGDTFVNFDELFNVTSEADCVADAVEELQLSMPTTSTG